MDRLIIKSILMKKLITLGICLFFFGSSFSQKLDYDKDSKWFLGFNVGGAWNTTDVKNKTNFGWGLILGRSFNYDYGKKVSFDLRLRYLGGNWYGQDYDTTNVTGNSFYNPDGNVAQTYGAGSLADSAGYGHTINNFNTEAHEIGLELAIHINSLREKTGWDPYIFGGIGAVWSQTQGDLYSQDALDTNNIYYQYSPSGISKAELNLLSDDIYDSPLDGSNSGYSVTIVPSLGIGLAYQIGPKFSIGLEHRTMFSLRNTFDGYAGDSKKWGMENDLYHYSGLVMKFNIGRKTEPETNTNTNTNTNSNNATTGGCTSPGVDFRKPAQRTIAVESSTYNVEAIIKEIAGRDNIQFFVNGSQSTNFTYNVSNEKFQSTVLLNSGENKIVIKASNACGVKEESVTINLNDCISPQINFSRPAGSSITVDQANFVVNATIINADNIEYQFNGLNSNNYSFSTNNFASNLRLQDGLNTVRIIARNECGIDEQTVQITYSSCTSPLINLLNRTGTITVNEPVFSFNAKVENVTSKQSIQFKVNGVNSDFTYNLQTKKFQGSIALNPGVNNLKVIASNECGANAETITVEYVPCIEPLVSYIQPAGTNTTVNTTTMLLKAFVQNVSSASQIQLKVNGVVRSGGTYNSSTKVFESTISLVDGENTIELKATNACASDIKTTKISKRPCVGPQLTMIEPSTQVTSQDNSSLLLKTVVMNVTSASQVKLFLNGIAILGGSYNASSHLFQKALNLNEGVNTIKIIATNDCSSEELVYTVTYTRCVAPTVTLVSPATPTTTSNPTMQVSALVTNVNSASQIVLKVNGATITGGSYNASTKIFTRTVTLAQGLNTIEVSASNDCGADKKSVNTTLKRCNAADISMISPNTESTTVNNSVFAIKATITNITSSNQVKLNVNGATIGGGTLNASTNLFEKSLTLSEGTNTISISATNDCGVKTETFVVIYKPCLAPTVSLITPVGSKINTDQETVLIKAKIENIEFANQITLRVNGTTVSGGSYNALTKIFEQNIPLSAGVNKINVIAITDCGQNFGTVTVTYSPCVTPTISLIEPTMTTISSLTGDVLVRANLQNVSALNQISVTINGSLVGGGAYNPATGLYQNNILVSENISTVVIKVLTNCGDASKSFVVKHTPCNKPTIDLIAPTSTQTTGTEVLIKASLENVSSVSQIVLKVNNVVISGGTYNAAGLFQKTILLSVGENVITIEANNECGTKELTTVMNREQMITICHQPEGNDEQRQQMEIPLSEWSKHQAHGDILGTCPTDSVGSQTEPSTGIGVVIGGSGGLGGGTVTGGNEDPGSEDPAGEDQEGGEEKPKEDDEKVITKPKDPSTGKSKGGK